MAENREIQDMVSERVIASEAMDDSQFIKPDLVSYFKSIIKPDMREIEKEVLNPEIPMFTKDMKISNITDRKDFAVFNSAGFLSKYIMHLKELTMNKPNKLGAEDWIAYDVNFRLNLLSSRGGFERRVQHSKIIDTKSITEEPKDEEKPRKPAFFGGLFKKRE